MVTVQLRADHSQNPLTVQSAGDDSRCSCREDDAENDLRPVLSVDLRQNAVPLVGFSMMWDANSGDKTQLYVGSVDGRLAASDEV